MPKGSPRPVRAGCTFWTPSSRPLGHIALRCFTAFSMTCIERPGGTPYLFSGLYGQRGDPGSAALGRLGRDDCEP